MAGPWDSPKLVTVNSVPKVLPLMRGIIPVLSHHAGVADSGPANHPAENWILNLIDFDDVNYLV
jgi:hypothetical protein